MNNKTVNEINMNNEGYIYLNNNIKVNAIKISLLNKLHNFTQKLME